MAERAAPAPMLSIRPPEPSPTEYRKSPPPPVEHKPLQRNTAPLAKMHPVQDEKPPLPTPPLQRSVINPKTHVEVNEIVYARLEVIGRGGSSKVYKLMASDGKQYALKKVNLKTADQFATEGYKNEISLLQKLHKNERIIRLVDAEVNDNFILMVIRTQLESGTGG